MPSKVYLKAYEAKISRLKRRLDKIQEARHLEAADSRRQKEHAHEVLTSYLAKIRRQEESLASNNMTITELEQQVAMQWKQRAEAQSDVERATKDGAEAIARHNKMVTWLQQAKQERDDAFLEITQLEYQLADARLTLQYRIWHATLSWVSRTKLSLQNRSQRFINRWLVKRLTPERMMAIREAGYVPEKLIHIAQKYWEMDRQRMGQTTKIFLDKQSDTFKTAKQNVWTRLRIFMGRA